MPKIHPGHEVLSLFGMANKHQALNQAAQHGLAATLIGAFLIVISASLLLAFSTGSFSLPSLTLSASASPAVADGNEAVAFQPGRVVTQQISQGYLGGK